MHIIIYGDIYSYITEVLYKQIFETGRNNKYVSITIAGLKTMFTHHRKILNDPFSILYDSGNSLIFWDFSHKWTFSSCDHIACWPISVSCLRTRSSFYVMIAWFWALQISILYTPVLHHSYKPSLLCFLCHSSLSISKYILSNTITRLPYNKYMYITHNMMHCV